MRQTTVKDVKKGDKILALPFDGKKGYKSWATITDKLPPRRIYDPGMTSMIELIKLTYVIDSGSQKGAKKSAWLEPDEELAIPDHPPKLKRIWKELWSK